MPHLKTYGDKRLWLELARPPYEFASPFGGKEFVVLIVANDPGLTSEVQMRLSSQIVNQGCRYAMATGHEASSWDDLIDIAYINRYPNGDPPDSEHIMTTWHDNETPDDIAQWFVLSTTFDFFRPLNFLILNIGQESELLENLLRCILAEFEGAG